MTKQHAKDLHFARCPQNLNYLIWALGLSCALVVAACTSKKPGPSEGSAGSTGALCGAPGLPCCSANSCTSSASQTVECVRGVCQACGNVSQACCEGNSCRSDLTSSRVLQCCRVPIDRFECRDPGAGGARAAS